MIEESGLLSNATVIVTLNTDINATTGNTIVVVTSNTDTTTGDTNITVTSNTSMTTTTQNQTSTRLHPGSYHISFYFLT